MAPSSPVSLHKIRRATCNGVDATGGCRRSLQRRVQPLAALSTIPAAQRRSRRFALCGLLGLALLAAPGCGPRIKWYPDYTQAQPVAQKQNQPMLLYFWDWLSRDRARMEMEVFSDPDVAAMMRRTVNVRLEQGWFRDRVRQYDVRTVPTFILINPQGAELSRLTGVPAPADFIKWLQTSIKQPQAADSPPTPATQPSDVESAMSAIAPASGPNPE